MQTCGNLEPGVTINSRDMTDTYEKNNPDNRGKDNDMNKYTQYYCNFD